MRLTWGDSLEKLKELGDNSVDSVVTDPPYGLAFMGKKWDYDVPSVELWREVLRVLKPGGHLLSFGGTRTYHRMVVNIEDAGFEIRDQIMWIYGSGFPKSHNIKEGDFKGWGTALKPANEPIVLARKPLEKGLTVAENVEKWGCGAINVDESRIEFQNKEDFDKVIGPTLTTKKGYKHTAGAMTGGINRIDAGNPQGRWPANVLFDEEAAAVLDEQSGERPSRGEYKNRKGERYEVDGVTWKYGGNVDNTYSNQTGGASRFFYVAKASKRERNEGLEGQTTDDGRNKSIDNPYLRGETKRQNHHPTVKPIKLMEYLIKLVTPPGGTVLDPFMGSGTTGCAAVKLGFNFIGIEREQEYVEIAKRRIEHWKQEEEETCPDEKNQLTMNI